MGLRLSLSVNEAVLLGDDIEIRVVGFNVRPGGCSAELLFTAPREVPIVREELLDKARAEAEAEAEVDGAPLRSRIGNRTHPRAGGAIQ
jgi:sRNA-binding carbon storage regulator CsrA